MTSAAGGRASPVAADVLSVEPDGPLASPELSLKLFVAEPAGVNVRELIPVFHRWIQQERLKDELMIDVAGYAHVPDGPGVLLICDLAHYSLELRGRPGLRYRRRRKADGTVQDRLRDAFRRAVRAARLLEEDEELGARYRFRTDEIEFGIYDRLRAPSTAESFEAVRPPLTTLLARLYQEGAPGVELVSGHREPFTVRISAPVALSLPSLLARLEQLEAGDARAAGA